MWDSTFDFSVKKIHKNDSYTAITIHGTNESKAINLGICTNKTYVSIDESFYNNINLNYDNLCDIASLQTSDGNVSISVSKDGDNTVRVNFIRHKNNVTISLGNSEIMITYREFLSLIDNAFLYLDESPDEESDNSSIVFNTEFEDLGFQENFEIAIRDWLHSDEFEAVCYEDEELRFDLFNCKFEVDPPKTLGSGYLVSITEQDTKTCAVFEVFVGKNCEQVIEFHLKAINYPDK